MNSDWREIKLEDYCEKVTVGHVGSMASKYKGSGIPFLRSLNIRPFHLDLSDVVYIDETFNKKLRKSELRSGDVVVVRTGYPGTACVVPDDLGTANCSDLVIIRTGDQLDPNFLTAIFNSAWGRQSVDGSTVGSAQQHFNIGTAKSMKFPAPLIDEQRLIGQIIQYYNDLLKINEKRIKTLEETASQLYKEWFVRMRFPGHKKVEFDKGLPKDWKITTLANEVHFKMGQSPKSEFYNENGIGLPFHQGVGTYGMRFPDHKIYCSVNGRVADEGDILFSVRAPVGRLNIADRKLIIGRGLSAMKHKKGLNHYLYYLLQNTFSVEDIIGNGSIFNSVGKDELKKFKIFDTGNLAKKFNEIISPIDDEIRNLIQQNQQLHQIRDRLLPRLISGKIQTKEVTKTIKQLN